MCRLLNIIAIIVTLQALSYSSVEGYKWIHVKPGSKIPTNAHILDTSLQTYIGRARHYEKVLPAEVYNTSLALIYTCDKVIGKLDFEILIDTEECESIYNIDLNNIPENIILVGNNWNGEPIYLGITSGYYYNHLAQVLLSSRQIIKWNGVTDRLNAIACKDPNQWVDGSSMKLPAGAIYGGKSANDSDIYVARLNKGCEVFPGQAIPDLGISTAVDKYWNHKIQSLHPQFLVGDSDDYLWVTAANGEIPDFAVVGGQDAQTNEFMYVVRYNHTLGYITHSKALKSRQSYEVLVKNE